MPQTRSQTAQAASQQFDQDTNVVHVNWLWFDKPRQREGRIIDIPHNLFTRPVQHCQHLFAEELQKACHFEVDVYNLKFWKLKESLLLETVSRPEWITSTDLSDVADLIPFPFELSYVLEGKMDKRYLHLLVTAEPLTESEPAYKEARDTLTGLPENQRYVKAIQYDRKSPSVEAKSKDYIKLQRQQDFAIYDGRYAANGNSTVAPPIQIFHPVFEAFIRRLEDPTLRSTRDFLVLVQRFMHEASEIRRKEAKRAQQYRKTLREILGYGIHKEVNDDDTEADGVISIEINGIRVRILMIELKREIDEGGCDPTTQAGLSARRYWVIQEAFNSIRDRCCCPTLIVAGGGPWMAILGAVLTDTPIVQRLTDMLWIGHSSTHQEARVQHLARVFMALRESVRELAGFYENLIKHMAEHSAFDSNKLGKPHPRFYPYAKCFFDGEQTVEFDYLRRLQDDATCVAFLAKTREDKPRDIVIKFVTDYGEEVHRFLADHDHAPDLFYCGPIPEATTIFENVPLPITEGATDRRLLPLMQMVVMDYVVPFSLPANREDAHRQLEHVLTLLHEQGYVFGDLRKPNVLFDANEKLKLIDFDWAGRYKQDSQGQQVTPSPDDGPVDTEYAHYPMCLSRNIDWAEGVKDLGPILPRHDKEMMNTLLNQLYHE